MTVKYLHLASALFPEHFVAHLTLTPESGNLLAHARSLLAQGEHQFAVAFAHAACELDQ